MKSPPPASGPSSVPPCRASGPFGATADGGAVVCQSGRDERLRGEIGERLHGHGRSVRRDLSPRRDVGTEAISLAQKAQRIGISSGHAGGNVSSESAVV